MDKIDAAALIGKLMNDVTHWCIAIRTSRKTATVEKTVRADIKRLLKELLDEDPTDEDVEAVMSLWKGAI